MTESFFGQAGTFNGSGDYNAEEFHIRQVLGQTRTTIPVKVVAVHGGGVGPAPTIDVQPLVNQTDGQGNQTPHGVIYGIPASRNQGGGNAVINDPRVGDVGFLSVADRDISALKANEGKQSNPGSFRRFDLADGIYTAAFLNPANPDQFMHFRDDGVTLADKNGNVIEMNSGGIIKVTGTLHVTGDIVAGFGAENISVINHLHGGVTPGGSPTDVPIPGS